MHKDVALQILPHIRDERLLYGVLDFLVECGQHVDTEKLCPVKCVEYDTPILFKKCGGKIFISTHNLARYKIQFYRSFYLHERIKFTDRAWHKVFERALEDPEYRETAVFLANSQRCPAQIPSLIEAVDLCDDDDFEATAFLDELLDTCPHICSIDTVIYALCGTMTRLKEDFIQMLLRALRDEDRCPTREQERCLACGLLFQEYHCSHLDQDTMALLEPFLGQCSQAECLMDTQLYLTARLTRSTSQFDDFAFEALE
jgi:hypothetical protein